MSRACLFVRVVFIDDDDLIDAVRQPMHHGVFCHIRLFGWRTLDNVVAPLERMHRKGVDVLQAAALAKLKEQIKDRENEPATAVFKNIQTMKNSQAGRLLAVMEFGYARSLGVTCTHCHTPDKWESEDKPQKQIARDMSSMVTTINRELLKNIKNLKSEAPIVNCTTCHRGEIKPAQNLPGK